MQDSRGTLVPPRHQVRGVQALTPEQGTDATRLLFGLIGFGQDSLLVLGCEDAAPGSGDDLGVGAAGTSLAGASLVGADPGGFGLAPLGLIALCG